MKRREIETTNMASNISIEDSQLSGDGQRVDTMTINMGPQHPSTHGVLRLILTIEGETVIKAVPDIGFLHTGIEKTAEAKTYNQALVLTDRMDYLAPLNNNLGYSLAVEKLLGIEDEMNDKIRYVRVREMILDVFELVSGVRMMTSYICPGGLQADLPPGFDGKVREFTSIFPERLQEYHDLLTNNQLWVERTKGVATLSAQDAIAYGASGPVLRGSGVVWDIRKAFPYSGYERFDFDIPVGANGDVYDRYLVRMLEMQQSLNIVNQALEGMPSGNYRVDNPKIAPPPRWQITGSMEALIHHFKLYTEGYRPPAGEVFLRTESPKGELGFYIVSDGSAKPYRMHVRGASFANLEVLPLMIEGKFISDVVAAIGSIDIVLGEVDR